MVEGSSIYCGGNPFEPAEISLYILLKNSIEYIAAAQRGNGVIMLKVGRLKL